MYGPYKVIRYLPVFCLQYPLSSFSKECQYVSHLLEGKNIRRKEGNPWPLSKKGAHIFHAELPPNISPFHQGITYAFLRQCGFNEDEAMVFYGPLSRSAYRCTLNRSTIQVVEDAAYIQQLGDFFKKYRDRMEEGFQFFYLNGLMLLKSEDAGFSLKGRTLNAVTQLNTNRVGHPSEVRWEGLVLPDGRYKRLVTWEVDNRSLTIREAKGKANSTPDGLCQSLIWQWSRVMQSGGKVDEV